MKIQPLHLGLVVVIMACTEGVHSVEGSTPTTEDALFFERDVEIVTDQPTTLRTPIGLALLIENGVGQAIEVRAGQRVFINQIDIATANATNVNQDLDSLPRNGDFAELDWRGLEFEEEEPVLLANPDGTFTNRRFFRGARWMKRSSVIWVWQEDDRGRVLSIPQALPIGSADRRRRSDAFFVRRLRGIQWINDCAAGDECSAATDFLEEAVVELRNSRKPQRSFRLHRKASKLRLWWSARQGKAYDIPLTQIEDPEWDYGFRISMKALTPPGPDGTYAPGTDVEFQITLADGSGKRLHPRGSLPTYADVVFGNEPSGIQYYRAFFDSTATYWRRKHRERMLMVQIAGPNQDIQPVYSIAELEIFLDEEDAEVVARPDVDGVYGEFTLLPPANVVFGGAFTPDNPQWFEPNVDRFTFHIPENANPGTYTVTSKGRRTYLGEDIPRSTFLEIQVGTTTLTEPKPLVGPCTSCHQEGGELSLVLHANPDVTACGMCHVPLSFELEGPISTRLHFIHSRSGRFDASLAACANCHLSSESTQRTSKHSCLSCHRDYPDDHVLWFGEIENIYIGGGRESFAQCTDRCHTTHPKSGFR